MLDKSKFLAYGESRHPLEVIMRMQAVKRWHMIEMGGRTQTLAEHSCNVATLAFLIAVTAPLNFFQSAYGIAVAAMFHDGEETFIGDIQTHVKRHLNSLGGDLKELESDLMPFVLKHPMDCMGRDCKMLIKLCDLADGIRFIRSHGKDITALHAQQGLEKQFEDLKQHCIGDCEWPRNVYDKVVETLTFYIYEKI